MGTANKFTMASSGGVWFLSKNYVRLKKSKKLKSKFLKSDDFKYVFIFPSITLLWDSGLLLQLRRITQRLWIVKYKLAICHSEYLPFLQYLNLKKMLRNQNLISFLVEISSLMRIELVAII